MWYVGGACSNTPPNIIVKNCWFNQQVNLLKLHGCHIYQSQWQWHHGVLCHSQYCQCLSQWTRWIEDWNDLPFRRTYRATKASSHVTVLYVKSTKPIPPNLFTSWLRKSASQLILRLIYALHICLLVSWLCFSTLFTSVIITSYKLLLRDSTLVHFGSCLV